MSPHPITACVSSRLSAYRLVVRGSNMPCAAGSLSLGPDNLYFRRRLRRAYPDTEQSMRAQREECAEVRRQFCPSSASEVEPGRDLGQAFSSFQKSRGRLLPMQTVADDAFNAVYSASAPQTDVSLRNGSEL